MDDRTTDYLAEIWGLFQALSLYKNIPVDFIDEAGLLEVETLKPFKVIFATVPDLPSAGASALGAWVKAGGTLVTVSNTGSHDEYHEPSTVLARPEQNTAPWSVRRALLMPQVNPGSSYCCGKSSF